MIQVSVPSLPSSKGTHVAMYTLLLLLVVQGSGSSFSDREYQGFSDFLDGVISCRGVTGGVVTLVKDERVVLTKSFTTTWREVGRQQLTRGFSSGP